ncbi:MAG TPA: nucleoside hydrolase [Treponema sp.]|nr:nucleoside hydrolase [Treponema sp.]
MKEWNYEFTVPEQKQFRMLIHTDCKNEADDQFAVVQNLMTPKFIVKGIIGGHFNKNPQEYGDGHTADASVREIDRVLDLMGLSGCYPVCKGSEYPLQNEETPVLSDGARMIIDEAMRDDSHPLFCVFQGAITDLASALLLKPEIASRMTAIWIGGGMYPAGGFEFNLLQDIAAANVVMKSQVPLWQVPITVYKQVSVSLAQLQLHVKPYGKIGKYLFEQMVQYNTKCAGIAHWPHGEIWGLGDTAAIAVLLQESERIDNFFMAEAPTVNYEDMTYVQAAGNRKIRVYTQVDARLVIDDFFAKLAINYPKADS